MCCCDMIFRKCHLQRPRAHLERVDEVEEGGQQVVEAAPKAGQGGRGGVPRLPGRAWGHNVGKSFSVPLINAEGGRYGCMQGPLTVSRSGPSTETGAHAPSMDPCLFIPGEGTVLFHISADRYTYLGRYF